MPIKVSRRVSKRQSKKISFHPGSGNVMLKTRIILIYFSHAHFSKTGVTYSLISDRKFTKSILNANVIARLSGRLGSLQRSANNVSG